MLVAASEHNPEMNIEHLEAVIQSLPEMGKLHVNTERTRGLAHCTMLAINEFDLFQIKSESFK